MKTAGVIAEYNPFHNGHQYHIEETRRRTGADYVIAVMSGSFVQRGAPALLDKYDRARMALHHGADLVFELPSAASLSSAEGFASGGVRLLAALGVVDYISCGCEGLPTAQTGEDVSDFLFDRIVSLLSEEPPLYRQTLSDCLKSGMSFPAARENAVRRCLIPPGEEEKTEKQRDLPSGINSLLSCPNNILALEYARAVRDIKSSVELIRIPRRGSGYHDAVLTGGYSSAGSIRRALLSGAEDEGALRSALPEDVCDTLLAARCSRALLCEDDFSDLLFYALTKSRFSPDEFGPAGSDLTQRIARLSEQFTTWSGFAALIKTKNQTYTAVSRCLAHILLDITREDLSLASGFHYAPYARLLGFRRDAAPLMRSLRANADIPVLTKPAQDLRALDVPRRHLFGLDLQASDIYRQILKSRSGRSLLPELRQPLIVV